MLSVDVLPSLRAKIGHETNKAFNQTSNLGLVAVVYV